MVLSADVSPRIISCAAKYLGTPYDYKVFDCVHFILNAHRDAGIAIPRFGGSGFPPSDLHMSEEEFLLMPEGRTVFFKRKASTANRIWTHAAIIYSSKELIHCSRHFGGKVVITPKPEFMNVYALAPQNNSQSVYQP